MRERNEAAASFSLRATISSLKGKGGRGERPSSKRKIDSGDWEEGRGRKAGRIRRGGLVFLPRGQSGDNQRTVSSRGREENQHVKI